MLTSFARTQEEMVSPSVDILSADELLKIEDLHTYFHTEQGLVKAVNGVSFDLRQSRVLGVVGESGCGKSMTALSVMQLLPEPKGKIHAGKILYNRGEKGVIDLAKQDPRGCNARYPRKRNRHDLSGADDFFESCHDGWGADHGSGGTAPASFPE